MLLGILFVCLFVDSSLAHPHTEVRNGLMALYNATGGPKGHWIHGKLWGTTASYCLWEGITCFDEDFIELDQDAGGLLGHLPNEIGLLGEHIIKLHLKRNTLSGPLPSTIGLMHNLVMFDIQQNAFNGTIPEEFSGLRKLQMFWIIGNRLTGSVHESLKPVLDRCAAFQPLGCRMAGNLFSCPVPWWIPPECDYGCVG